MDTKWLNDLEEKVNAATEEIKSLRKKNKTQENKIKKLQDDLAAARQAGKSSAGWEKQQEAIRKRVEKLAAGLEKLL